MNKMISIGEIRLEASNYKESYIESPFSGRSLLVANFDCFIKGVLNNKKLLDILDAKEVSFKLNVDDKQERKVKAISRVWSYSGPTQTESTLYNHKIELEEIDPDEPEKWSLLAAQFEAVIGNRMLIKTLTELLQQKGIFTKEQFEEKIEEVENRDYEEFRELLIKGPKDSGKQAK